MEEYQVLPMLLLLMFGAGSGGPKKTESDAYSDFRQTPAYIENAKPKQKEYFEAYDAALKHWNVAYEELYVPTSKGVAHVVTSGPKNGTPIVLLHGMGASATMWYTNAKELAANYRLFAIDVLVEPGKSYQSDTLENIDALNPWFDEIFSALNLDSFYIMGPSRGGWLAVNLALHSKRDIRGLVLLSPVQTFVWVPPSWDVVKNMLNVFYPKEERIARTMATLSKDPSQINEDYLKQYRLGRKIDTLNKFIPQMKPFSRDELRRLNMPVLVLVGDDDMLNNPQAIKKAKKYLPDFFGGVLGDSGHFLSVDQNERVNWEINSFLETIENRYSASALHMW